MTVTRETSRDAYAYLIRNDLLRKKQARFVAALLDGDATSGEILQRLRSKNPNADRARFTELLQRGLIVEAGVRRSKATGRSGIVWRFTGRTKPLKTTRVRRGAKAWKALAMRLWGEAQAGLEATERAGYESQIRALGGRP